MIDKVNGIQNVFRQFKSPSLDPKMKISFYISSSRLASFSFEAALASVGLLVSLAQAQGKSGQGRIRNLDESMCFSYNTASKSWTV